MSPGYQGFHHDVIIVGSGTGDAMAAWVLTRSGLRVLMLEAGRDYDPARETPMFHTQAEAPLRAASTADKPFGCFDATVDGGWRVPGEPYTVAAGSEFLWWRSRMLGGRTNPWGQTWDVPNLCIFDGGVFVSNPTRTAH